MHLASTPPPTPELALFDDLKVSWYVKNVITPIGAYLNSVRVTTLTLYSEHAYVLTYVATYM